MIIWLASYPKSGNTWLRSIVSSLLYSEDGYFNIDLLKKIDQFPQRKFFENLTNDFYNIHEIKKNWITAQDKLNLDNKIKVLKTHNLNCTIDNHAFTNKNNTVATIYIVRDPRNLVNSISNHFNKSPEEAKNFILTSKVISGYSQKNSRGGDVITLIGSWQEHYQFWTKKNENLLLIKYEDLIEKPFEEMDKLINFLKKYVKVSSDKKKVENILNSSSFDALKKIEEQGLFTENVFEKNSDNKIKFFNLGPDNDWKKSLTKDIQKEIETKLEVEMKELNYL